MTGDTRSRGFPVLLKQKQIWGTPLPPQIPLQNGTSSNKWQFILKTGMVSTWHLLPCLLQITCGYSRRAHNKISDGTTKVWLHHPERHSQDECESLLCPAWIMQVCSTWAMSSPWLWPPPGLRSVPGTWRPQSGQPWLPCAALSLLSAHRAKAEQS